MRTARRALIAPSLRPLGRSLPLSSGPADASSSTDQTSLAQVVNQIGASAMWAAGYTGTGVDVAVIDTGVARVAELSTTNVVVGPDFSLEGGNATVAGLDTYGHGTHIVGIIAGRTPGADPLHPRASDFIGVAPDARIISVKVADSSGAVDVSQVISAIDWVVQNQHEGGLNIRVLNLSYNTREIQSELLDPLSKAVENAWRHGIVVVVSAGNEGMGSRSLANPATNPYVIAVSAATKSSGKWSLPSWASTGDGFRNPDVVAPGVSIKSLRNPSSRLDIEHAAARVEDGRLFLGSGTSQAAAVVSGAAALLLQQRPGLTPDQVKDLLKVTADTAGAKRDAQGSGAINLAKAMVRPARAAVQQGLPATGLGSLEKARGIDHVVVNVLTLSEARAAWSGSSWSASSWSGSSWS